MISNHFNFLFLRDFKRYTPKILKQFKCSGHSWTEPNGFDTGISIFNSVIKQKVNFVTKRNKIVSWYSCGPTVYDTAHIGNISSYMRFDIIRRIMMNYFDLNVIMVMNITDIDDKIINRSKTLEIDWKSLTDSCTKEFFQDLRSLNIQLPSIVAKVTDHIPFIIDFIQALVDKGYGYVAADGSVYFSLSKYPGYGKFQRSSQEEQEEATSTGVKEQNQDFVLWKAAKPGEPFWNSPWGVGRPGWHIECSAIASKFLGDTIDLHSGGVDLKFPHHENEDAQCCARHGFSQWVNYWIHAGHLYTKTNEKMSKSLHNTISTKDFLLNHSGNTFRTLCLMIPYQNNIEFRPETVEKAAVTSKKFSQFLSEIHSYLRGEGETKANIDESHLFKIIVETEEKIKIHLSNDFATNKVVTELLNLISTTNSMFQASSSMQISGSPHCLAAVSNTLCNTLEGLGFSFTEQASLQNEVTDEILDSTVDFRSKIREIALGIGKKDSQELLERKMKLLEACDSVRDGLLRSGIELKDRGKVTTWSYSVKQPKSSIGG